MNLKNTTTKIKLSHDVFLKLQRRKYQTPTIMKCILINQYAKSVDELRAETYYNCPTLNILKANEALVKVHAASISPIDIEMMKGFGQKPINILRGQAGLDELPLILGRDFSGTIVECGQKFKRFLPGDQVYGIAGICRQGTHAEYVKVNKHEVSPIPTTITTAEAASLPAIACVAWSVFIDSGVLSSDKPKRIFIPGGSGGFGTFAIQLCQVLGHDVVTSCHAAAIPLLQSLGMKNIIDYQSDTYKEDLRSAGPFNIVLDTIGSEKHTKLFKEVIDPNFGSKFICIHPYLLEEADNKEMMVGQESAIKNVLQFTINQIYTGKGMFSMGFCGLNGRVLDNVRSLVDEGKIKPVIHKQFSIDHGLAAYRFYEQGKSEGKVVITMPDERR